MLIVIGSVAGFLVFACLSNPSIRVWLNPDYRSQVLRFGEILWLTNFAYFEEDRSGFEQLTEEAITGMAKSLDPYSVYFPPEALKEYYENTNLKYFGAGFKTRQIQEEIVVTRVNPGGPAERAKLRLGDRILDVDGETTTGKSVQDCLRLIRGPAGTEVLLRVRRLSGEIDTLRIKRSQIDTSPVDDFWVDANGNGYIRLAEFTEKVGKEVGKALEVMQKQDMKCLVLDLRDNPGGKMFATVEVAGFFLSPNTLIVTTHGKLPELTLQFRSKAQKQRVEIPMAVLINEKSASGAECLAGALKCHGRAILVGEKTFGKGTFQQLFPVSHDSGLHLTIGKYDLPDGSNVNEKGVEPDYQVPCDPESVDKLWVQRDRQGIIDPDEFKKLFGFSPIPDPQWLKAIEVVNRDE
ncbi:MAG: S41 family peptidase [Verrucomicrobiae bacterium]|nr:S41 family peptidase [Verrucomicrobiae bacterium]